MDDLTDAILQILSSDFGEETNMATMNPVKKKPVQLISSTDINFGQRPALTAIVGNVLLDKYIHEAKTLNRLTVSDYAMDVATSISTISDNALEKTKVSDINEFSDGLSKIVLLTGQIDFSKINAVDKAEGLFGKLKSLFAESREKVASRMTSVEERIQEISEFLSTRIDSMKSRNINLENLFASNMEEYNTLEAAIQALVRVQEDEKQKLERMQGGSDSASNLSMLKISDQIDFVNKIEVRLDYLRKMQQLALLAVPEIRRSQNNNINLIDKFNTIRTMTLPAWRKQLRLIIESMTQKKDATIGKAVDDQTNEFMKKSADLSGQNYVEVTRLSQRSVVDTSTLQYMTDALVKSTADAQAIIDTASAERAQTEQAISAMKQQMKQVFNPMKRISSN